MTDPKTEIGFRSQFATDEAPILHHREHPTLEAQYALNMIDRWGVVAGKPDGEDSAGRSILCVVPEDEVVSRAFNLAEKAFAEARRRGLMVEVPSWEECRELARAERARN